MTENVDPKDAERYQRLADVLVGGSPMPATMTRGQAAKLAYLVTAAVQQGGLWSEALPDVAAFLSAVSDEDLTAGGHLIVKGPSLEEAWANVDRWPWPQ